MTDFDEVQNILDELSTTHKALEMACEQLAKQQGCFVEHGIIKMCDSCSTNNLCHNPQFILDFFIRKAEEENGTKSESPEDIQQIQGENPAEEAE